MHHAKTFALTCLGLWILFSRICNFLRTTEDITIGNAIETMNHTTTNPRKIRRRVRADYAGKFPAKQTGLKKSPDYMKYFSPGSSTWAEVSNWAKTFFMYSRAPFFKCFIRRSGWNLSPVNQAGISAGAENLRVNQSLREWSTQYVMAGICKVNYQFDWGKTSSLTRFGSNSTLIILPWLTPDQFTR